MERIASFSVDHRKIIEGLYISRVDGDVITYDVRMRRPNQGDYLSNGSLHTLEHLFATYARNSKFGASIVYVGPMGCRTGCYFLTRDTMSNQDTLDLIRESMAFIAAFEGEIPGAKEEECGNYREHSLSDAKRDAERYLKALESWSVERMKYPE